MKFSFDYVLGLCGVNCFVLLMETKPGLWAIRTVLPEDKLRELISDLQRELEARKG